MVRFAITGIFLVSILSTSFANLGQLPATLLRPTGVMQLLSWRFYDVLLTPQAMSWLKWVMLVSLTLSTIGYLTSITTKTTALLVLFYEGLLRSFGHFNHDEMLAVYCLIVLAFSPCGEGFSVDAVGRRRPNKGRLAYGYPILLMQLLVAWTYFSSGLIKLRVAGLSYFGKDSLPALAILHSLDNFHDTSFRLAFLLPAIRDYLPIVLVFIVLWELLFPLAVFFRQVRWLFLVFGVLFHLGTQFFMNIFFPFHLGMYVVFIDWPKVAAWLGSRGMLQRPIVWWRKFRSVPEEFPDLHVDGLSSNGLLLWDGDCGFCASMVLKMKQRARRPFADAPYQSVKAELPDEILRWSTRQAHWIDSQGHVTGGSAAFVELLENSGRPLCAAVMRSAALRPFLWLGYRFVAANRGMLSKALRRRRKS